MRALLMNLRGLMVLLIGSLMAAHASAQSNDDEEWNDSVAEYDLATQASSPPAATDAQIRANTDGTSTSEAPSDNGAAQTQPRRNRTRRMPPVALPSLTGTTGGLHLTGAETGEQGSTRFALGFGYFSTSDMLIKGDSHEQISFGLEFSWTPLTWLETYFSLQTQASSNGAFDPDLIMTLGDVSFGAKYTRAITKWLSIALDAGLLVPTAGSDVGLELGALGLDTRLSATANVPLSKRTPLLLRLNLGYRLDNSSELVSGTEDARYDSLDSPAPRKDETRHLINRFERFGLGVSRTDLFELGLGAEIVFRIGKTFELRPLVEWTWGLPVNRQGYDCVTARTSSDDSCVADEGVSSTPMNLTLGVRTSPFWSGLSMYAASDIGLTGVGPEHAVRELPAVAPYKVLVGFTYSYTPYEPPPPPPPIIREIERRVEVRQPEPPRGRVLGTIVEHGTQTGVADVQVELVGKNLTNQVSAADGHFASFSLEPGPVELRLTREGYEPGSCTAEIPAAGGDVPLNCELTKILVRVQEQQIEILEQINFAFNRAEILDTSLGLMEQIANTIVQHPEIRRIEIQGHTDDVGTETHNQRLSQARAESVQAWLMAHGVEAGRLMAHGYGETVPLVDNTTDENRARNRRVQFMIVERAQQTPTEAAPAAAPAPDVPAPPAPTP